MRRLFARRSFAVAFLVAAFAAQGSTVLGPASAADTEPSSAPGGASPREDRSRGLVYEGLRRSDRTSHCQGSFELAGVTDRAGRPLCTHGPDPAPPGVDVRARRDPPAAAATAGAAPAPATAAEAGGAIACEGDGSSGPRVQVIYARSSSVADRYDQFADSFQQWLLATDAVFNNSAARTWGVRHVRFVTDASCRAKIERVVLSSSGDDNLTNTVSELSSKGYSRSDRKYLVFMDAYVYCGIGEIYRDNSPGPDNWNNGPPWVSGMVARVDAGCWGQWAPVEAHELMHTLGGVQPTAPNGTPGFHCTDESDRMCYSDGTGAGSMRSVCPDGAGERLFDCRNDDYFHTSLRGTSSWLATHWNTANSRFLMSTGSVSSSGSPPSTTTTTVAPGVGLPSAPQYLRATTPASGSGVSLSWVRPSSSPAGPVTGYRIYRGTTSTNLTLLGSITTPPPHVDRATERGTLYYYQVSALNSAGEGRRSSLAARTAV